MRLATRDEMQRIDKEAVSQFGMAADQLMEKAGTLMAERIMSLPGMGKNHRICIFCGPGHNGGDGLVVARKLLQQGFQYVDVWKMPLGASSMLFELNLRRLQEAKASVRELEESHLVNFDFNKYEILVDAIFGTGLNRPLDASLVKFIERINKQNVSTVALDVPTGLDVNTGRVWGAAIRSIKTLTCGLSKPGFYLNEGPQYAGRVEVLDIDLPKKLLESVATSSFLIGGRSAKKILPRRRATENKTHFGKLLVLAGSPGMKGAGVLTGLAAARMGAGYVTLASPFAKVLNQSPPDFLGYEWKNISKIDFNDYSAVAIGPGLGRNPETQALLRRLKEEGHKKVLVDADALNMLAKSSLLPLPDSWIITPHAGELARILKISAAEIESDRLHFASEASQKLGCGVLLKGFRTVLAVHGKRYIIGSGNVALAKAGTGDVLTGFISSLMAQGLSSDRAAALGAYLHGRIADLWVRSGGSPRTLMASDLPVWLHKVLAEIE